MHEAQSNRLLPRQRTRPVRVGGIAIGGGAPVTVQSMTNTRTADAAATLAQIDRLVADGCEIVRVATPTAEDTAALREIVRRSPVPVVADVHFHFQRALEAVAAGVHKIRLNPGNIEDRAAVLSVIGACKAAGIPIRVGVNEGSVKAPGQARSSGQPVHGEALAELMVGALDEYLRIFQDTGFDDLVLSAKSHDAAVCIAVYRAMAERFPYPLHVGLTHAGTIRTGLIRSVAAVGSLLAEGIGDTIRISLAGDPVAEVEAGKELLASLHLRPREGVEIIACPTCGRTSADVAGLAEDVRAALAGVREHVTVAVMGCVVNGPGEAKGADVAVCCGGGKAAIYRAGRQVRAVGMDQVRAALLEEVRSFVQSRSGVETTEHG